MESFHYSTKDTNDLLEKLVIRYQRSGRAIRVDFRELVDCLSTVDRATHLIHPYPAKLLMHIPFFFLANEILSKPGDVVLDPFAGSGTVLLEAQLSSRLTLGADSNPLARLISKVKTTPIHSNYLKRASARLMDRIPSLPKSRPPDVVNLSDWFFPEVVEKLQCISEAINRTRIRAIKEFFMICLSNCARKISLADPRFSVPVRLRIDKYPAEHPFRVKAKRYLTGLRNINVISVYKQILDSNIRRMARLDSIGPLLPPSEIICSDARKLRYEYSENRRSDFELPNESINLIITSPPYPGAQKYIRSSSLSLGWLSLCATDELLQLKRATIGREEYYKSECSQPINTGVISADRLLRKIHQVNPVRATIAGTYLIEMRDAIREMHRVLKPGGHLVLVAANNRISGYNFRTQTYLQRIAEELNFCTILRLVDSIRSHGLMTKRNSTASIIDREWVLVFRKK